MIIVNINPEETYSRVAGLWQYDYGQVLRIQGLSLPPAIEIHFSLQETGGETVTRVGVTKDGATDVVIPDFILEGAGSIEDYFAYAFIYPSDENSGQTEHRIEIGVKSRPKPEGYKGSGDDTMGAVMKAVNEIAAGKADGLEYKNSILRLMSGDAELARVTISGGSGGENGITPHIGENGNWYLGEADTGVKASGSDGITPHIGDNGNWYIGETDTGVKAEAPSTDSALTESGKAADAKITGEKISELKNDIDHLSEEKVGNPPTGSVGQILEIETVDENGKPKTYKAVNKPIGGGEVTDEQISNAVDNYMAANPIEETDPTVPDWAKQPDKPSYTASDVGADAAGTAESKVSVHNTATDSHNDIRELISGLTQRLNALADSDDTTLDQMSEVVAYIKSNKSLIDAITTSKVNVSDIIDNLTTNVSNKPLSAAQGAKLKALIDAIPEGSGGSGGSSEYELLCDQSFDLDGTGTPIELSLPASPKGFVLYLAIQVDSPATSDTMTFSVDGATVPSYFNLFNLTTSYITVKKWFCDNIVTHNLTYFGIGDSNGLQTSISMARGKVEHSYLASPNGDGKLVVGVPEKAGTLYIRAYMRY